MVPRAAAPTPYTQTRAKTYFERTLQLFNLHDVEPVLVIMPYHPTALAAFRAAGWDAKEDAFKAYLESLRGRYRFHLLDYTDLASFHGDAGAFYDGAHVTASNARRILAQAVKDAPASVSLRPAAARQRRRPESDAAGSPAQVSAGAGSSSAPGGPSASPPGGPASALCAARSPNRPASFMSP